MGRAIPLLAHERGRREVVIIKNAEPRRAINMQDHMLYASRFLSMEWRFARYPGLDVSLMHLIQCGGGVDSTSASLNLNALCPMPYCGLPIPLLRGYLIRCNAGLSHAFKLEHVPSKVIEYRCHSSTSMPKAYLEQSLLDVTLLHSPCLLQLAALLHLSDTSSIGLEFLQAVVSLVRPLGLRNTKRIRDPYPCCVPT